MQASATESYLVRYDGQWCSLLAAKDPSASFPLAGVLGAPERPSRSLALELLSGLACAAFLS